MLQETKLRKQGRCNEGFNAEPITFAICILHFAFRILISCQNLDSIGVVVGGVHSDNRGTYSFGHSASLGSHENFRYEQNF